MFSVKVSAEITEDGTAVKLIELPFVPFEGLQIKEKLSSESTMFDEYTIQWVEWDVTSQRFDCQVWFGLGSRIEVSYEHLETRGWTQL
jgi:hypothetical protein